MECIFQGKGLFVVSLDARSKSGMKSITDIVMEACKEKIERDRKRGIKKQTGKSYGGGGFQTSESPHLSIHTPEKPVPRQETSRA